MEKALADMKVGETEVFASPQFNEGDKVMYKGHPAIVKGVDPHGIHLSIQKQGSNNEMLVKLSDVEVAHGK